jgi:Zn finger protein HypA/HybF involved in hydrogenase expression
LTLLCSVFDNSISRIFDDFSVVDANYTRSDSQLLLARAWDSTEPRTSLTNLCQLHLIESNSAQMINSLEHAKNVCLQLEDNSATDRQRTQNQNVSFSVRVARSGSVREKMSRRVHHAEYSLECRECSNCSNIYELDRLISFLR